MVRIVLHLVNSERNGFQSNVKDRRPLTEPELECVTKIYDAVLYKSFIPYTIVPANTPDMQRNSIICHIVELNPNRAVVSETPNREKQRTGFLPKRSEACEGQMHSQQTLSSKHISPSPRIS
jgi:hypothetical protein